MKKFCLTGAVLIMALLIAAPSFAVEHKVTGTLTLDGILNMNSALSGDSDEKKTTSYREMQLRIHTESQVTDKITFYTRFDILDKVLSSQFSNTVDSEDDDNIQFDHAWMQIISQIGVFRLGRKEGVKWGTDFFDDGDDYGTDRAEWILPIDVGTSGDKFVFAAIAEKALETKEQNRDNDKFYVTGTYVGQEYKTGLLVGLYKYNSYKEEANVDPMTTASDTLVAGGIADPDLLSNIADFQKTIIPGHIDDPTYTPRGGGSVMYYSPYYTGKIGPITINAEIDYISGELDFYNIDPALYEGLNTTYYAGLMQADPTNPANVPTAAAMAQGTVDAMYGNQKDVEMMAYWLEAAYEAGPANIELGYAFMSGDEDGGLNDLEAAALLGQGEDWEKMFILTGDDHGMDLNLGGDGTSKADGNILNIGSDMSYAGLSLMYLGANYDINDSINIGGIVGYAMADKKLKKTDATGATYYVDDSYGTEIDLTLTWKFMGNLQYNGTAAYLIADDFWKKGIATAEIDDCLALYHELVLSF